MTVVESEWVARLVRNTHPGSPCSSTQRGVDVAIRAPLRVFSASTLTQKNWSDGTQLDVWRNPGHG